MSKDVNILKPDRFLVYSNANLQNYGLLLWISFTYNKTDENLHLGFKKNLEQVKEINEGTLFVLLLKMSAKGKHDIYQYANH